MPYWTRGLYCYWRNHSILSNHAPNFICGCTLVGEVGWVYCSIFEKGSFWKGTGKSDQMFRYIPSLSTNFLYVWFSSHHSWHSVSFSSLYGLIWLPDITWLIFGYSEDHCWQMWLRLLIVVMKLFCSMDEKFIYDMWNVSFMHFNFLNTSSWYWSYKMRKTHESFFILVDGDDNFLIIREYF